MTTTETATRGRPPARRDRSRTRRGRRRPARAGSSTTARSPCWRASGTTPASSRPSRPCRRRRASRSPTRPGSTSATCASGSAAWCAPSFVEYDPAARAYALCPEVRAVRHRAPVPTTSPGRCGSSPSWARCTPKVIECFRHGGGLSYDDYPGFHDVQADDSAAVNDAALVDTIIPLTGLVGPADARASTSLDVGCGEGHAVNLLARAFPRSRSPASTSATEAVAAARAEADAWGLPNATLRGAGRGGPAGRRVRPGHRLRRHPRPGPARRRCWPRPARPAPGRHASSWSTSTRPATSRTTSPCRGAASCTPASTLHCMAVSLGQGGDGAGHRVGRAAGGADAARRRVRRGGRSTSSRTTRSTPTSSRDPDPLRRPRLVRHSCSRSLMMVSRTVRWSVTALGGRRESERPSTRVTIRSWVVP